MNLSERLLAFIAKRERQSVGHDVVTGADGVLLTLADLREAAAVVARDQWQPIETAPDGVEAFVTGYNYGEPKFGRYYSAAKLDGGIWYGPAADDGEDELGWLTHWKPLHAPGAAHE